MAIALAWTEGRGGNHHRSCRASISGSALRTLLDLTGAGRFESKARLAL
jgi:hypothetical protein